MTDVAVTDQKVPVSKPVSLEDTLAVIKKKLAKKHDKFTAWAQKQMFAAFQHVLERHPRIDAVHWLQYTDYFNDGAECYFRVHDPYFTYEGETHCAWEPPSEEYTGHAPDVVTDYRAALELAHEIQNAFSEETFEMVFGDHSEIKITRTSLERTDYTSHD